MVKITGLRPYSSQNALTSVVSSSSVGPGIHDGDVERVTRGAESEGYPGGRVK